MILVVDGDLIMVVGSPTRDYKSGVLGWRHTHLESEFLGKSSYPVIEIEEGEKFEPKGTH